MAAAKHTWSHLTPAQKASLQDPIAIALMTGHMFGRDYARGIDSCWLHGKLLNCAYLPASSRPAEGQSSKAAEAADALWYHGPSICGSMQVSTKHHNKQHSQPAIIIMQAYGGVKNQQTVTYLLLRKEP